MLRVIMLSVVMLSVVMLSVVMLSVVKLSVVAPAELPCRVELGLYSQNDLQTSQYQNFWMGALLIKGRGFFKVTLFSYSALAVRMIKMLS